MRASTRTLNTMVLALALCIAGNAWAAVTTYTDRSTWLGAGGPASFTADFESFATDTSFATSPVNVGPFTLSTIGTASADSNFIDASPFAFSPIPPSFGNACAEIFVQDPVMARLDLSSPVSGLFTDFLYAGNGEQLQLTVSLLSGATAELAVPGTGTDLVPFGFISSDDPITGITFHNIANDGFIIDNVSGQGVPEPCSASLIGLGLVASWISRRWKRQRSA